MQTDSNSKPSAFSRQDAIFVVVLFVTAIVLFLPTFIFGIPDSYDLHQHFQFAATYVEAFRSGVIFPDWGAWENSGLGGIGIRLYPPLAHYVLAAIELVVGDWFVSASISFVFWTFVGAAGIYLFAREFMTPGRSLIVALVFTCSPFRLGQLYQAFFYSEYVAASVLPFCLLYLTRICRRQSTADALKLGLSLALLVLSHIPTTIIAAIPLMLYTLLILDRKTLAASLPKLTLSAAVGLAASSFFWIRLVTEVGMVSHADPAYFSGHYDFRGGLFPRIFNSPERYFAKQMWGLDLVALFSLLPLLPPLLIALFRRSLFKYRAADRKVLAAMIVSGLFGFFMASLPSLFIWERVGLLQRLQFPFRWLSIPVLFGAVALVWSLGRVTLESPVARRLAVYGTGALVFVIALFNITQVIIPSAMLSREVFEADRINGILTKESYECWWPIWAKPNAFADLNQVKAAGREVRVANWGPFERAFSIAAGEPREVRVATFYYPYWKLRIDGEAAETSVAPDGSISFMAPARAIDVTLRFEQPFSVELTKYITVTAWAITLVMTVLAAVSRRRDSEFVS